MITIHLLADIHPDHAATVRAGLVDKLWECGVPVDRVVIEAHR